MRCSPPQPLLSNASGACPNAARLHLSARLLRYARSRARCATRATRRQFTTVACPARQKSLSAALARGFAKTSNPCGRASQLRAESKEAPDRPPPSSLRPGRSAIEPASQHSSAPTIDGRLFHGIPARREGDRSARSAQVKECREIRSARETIPPSSSKARILCCPKRTGHFFPVHQDRFCGPSAGPFAPIGEQARPNRPLLAYQTSRSDFRTL